MRVSPPSTRPDFERMGEIRFRRKVGRFERLLMTSSPGQVFYRGVMIGLGYRPNQAPFEELSRLVPLVCLRGKNGRKAFFRVVPAAAGVVLRAASIFA